MASRQHILNVNEFLSGTLAVVQKPEVGSSADDSY